MAAQKKHANERLTHGPSYSGQHSGLRRHLTQTYQDFETQDQRAAAEGLSWAQWARAALKHFASRKASALSAELRVKRADKRVGQAFK